MQLSLALLAAGLALAAASMAGLPSTALAATDIVSPLNTTEIKKGGEGDGGGGGGGGHGGDGGGDGD